MSKLAEIKKAKDEEKAKAEDDQQVSADGFNLDAQNPIDAPNDLEPQIEVDNLSTTAIDDNFLTNFENLMLVSTSETEDKQLSTEKMKLAEEKVSLNPVIPEHQKQVEDMIERSGLEVDVKTVSSIESVENTNIDFDRLDVSSIDLTKLNIKFDEPVDLKIGFDLNKINITDMQINLDEVDVDNIDFTKIKVDLGQIVSFNDTTKEIKKRNLLLPSPVKGFYGRLVLNPYQELRNAFRKSYKEILQMARPGEAFQKQIEEGMIINADDIIEAHKKAEEKREAQAAAIAKEKKEKTDTSNVELDKLAEQQLQEELGTDWNKMPELEKKDDKKKGEEKPKTDEKKAAPKVDRKKALLSFLHLAFHKTRSFYLRFFLISWTTKFLVVMHFAVSIASVYVVVSKINVLMQFMGSTRVHLQPKSNDIEDLADSIKEPNKRLPGPFVSIERIIGSFKDERTKSGTKLFQISLYIEASDDKTQEEINSRLDFFRDKIVTYLNSLNAKETEGSLGKERVKFGILSAINDELKEGQAVSIFFSDFMMNP